MFEVLVELIKNSEKLNQKYNLVFKKHLQLDSGNLHLKILCAITSYILKSEDLHTPYSPYSIFNGSRSSVPDDLTYEELDLIENGIDEIKDPELLSRIADVIWIRRKNIKYAYLAIDNYLKSAENLKTDSYFYSSNLLERALRLSSSLKKGGEEYFEKSVESVISILRNDIPEDFGFFPLRLVKLLLEFSNDSLDLCVSELKIYIEKLKNIDIFRLNDYLELLAQVYDRQKEKELASECRVEIAENYVSVASQEKNAMGEVYNLQKAIEIFRKVGGKRERINEVHLQLLEVQKRVPEEMRIFTAKSDDIAKLINYSKDHVSKQTLKDALIHFCFISSPTKFEEHKGRIEKIMNGSVFKNLFSTYSVDKYGRVTSYIPPIRQEKYNYDEVLLAQMVQGIGLNWELVVKGGVLPAKDQIMIDHVLDLESFLPFIKNNPLIRPGRESLVAQGFLYGFQDRWDLSASLLIPQFEDALLYILSSRGFITSRIEDDFKQEDLGINECFKNYFEELVEIFEKDICFDLKCLLTRDSFGNGSNLRNRFAHGKMDQGEFYAIDVIYFWWLYFRLICTPLIKQELRQD